MVPSSDHIVCVATWIFRHGALDFSAADIVPCPIARRVSCRCWHFLSRRTRHVSLGAWRGARWLPRDGAWRSDARVCHQRWGPRVAARMCTVTGGVGRTGANLACQSCAHSALLLRSNEALPAARTARAAPAFAKRARGPLHWRPRAYAAELLAPLAPRALARAPSLIARCAWH